MGFSGFERLLSLCPLDQPSLILMVPMEQAQPPLGLPAGWEELWDWPGQLAFLPCWELPEPPLGCPGGNSSEKQISEGPGSHSRQQGPLPTTLSPLLDKHTIAQLNDAS